MSNKTFYLSAEQFSVHLRENECYPDGFKPFGGFADHIPVENGYVRLPDSPGVRFETKKDVYEVMRQVNDQ